MLQYLSKIFIVSIIFFFFIGIEVKANICDFDTTDWVMLSTYGVLDIIDHKQTSKIDDKNMEELNPLLGKHPSQRKINQAFIIGGLAFLGAACYIENPYRKWFLSGALGAKGITVYWNYRLGL